MPVDTDMAGNKGNLQDLQTTRRALGALDRQSHVSPQGEPGVIIPPTQETLGHWGKLGEQSDGSPPWSTDHPAQRDRINWSWGAHPMVFNQNY